MPYGIDESLSVGDSGHVEHHEAMAVAVNDLDTRVTAKVDSAALTELVQDIVGSMLVQGTNVTIAYNDTTGQATISFSGGGSTAWGSITGTLSSQTDLTTALSGKSATGHTHVAANITDLASVISAEVADSTIALAGTADTEGSTFWGVFTTGSEPTPPSDGQVHWGYRTPA